MQEMQQSWSTAFWRHQKKVRRGIKNNKTNSKYEKKGKRKIQGVPQSQTTALHRHQEEEETDKFKQAQIEQTYEKN